MTKVLPATCEASVVSVEGQPIADAVILSEGVGSSEGVAVMQGEDVTYIGNTTADLKTTLEKLILALTQTKTALDQIGSALTTLDGKPLGTLTPAPAVTANVSQIATAATQIEAAKAQLDTLKGVLK